MNPLNQGCLKLLTDATLAEFFSRPEHEFTCTPLRFQNGWCSFPFHLSQQYDEYRSVLAKTNGTLLSILLVRPDGRTVWRNLDNNNVLLSLTRASPITDHLVHYLQYPSLLVRPYPPAPDTPVPTSFPSSSTWPHLQLRINDVVMTVRGYISIGPRCTDWWISIANRGQDLMLQLGSGPIVLHSVSFTSPFQLSLLPADFLATCYRFSNNFRVLSFR